MVCPISPLHVLSKRLYTLWRTYGRNVTCVPFNLLFIVTDSYTGWREMYRALWHFQTPLSQTISTWQMTKSHFHKPGLFPVFQRASYGHLQICMNTVCTYVNRNARTQLFLWLLNSTLEFIKIFLLFECETCSFEEWVLQ